MRENLFKCVTASRLYFFFIFILFCLLLFYIYIYARSVVMPTHSRVRGTQHKTNPSRHFKLNRFRLSDVQYAKSYTWNLLFLYTYGFVWHTFILSSNICFQDEKIAMIADGFANIFCLPIGSI